MKRFPKILTAGLSKAWKRPLALLVCVTLLVTVADLALMTALRPRETAHRASSADALRPFHLDAANASAADRPFSTGATGSLQAAGYPWNLPLPRWSSFTLPYGGGRWPD
jgi:hypothetical protein